MDLTPESNEIVIRIKCDFPEKQPKEAIKERSEFENNDLLTVTDLCKHLNCQPSYIYRLTHERKIPFLKLGGRTLRFEPKAIEKWLTDYRIEPSDNL